MTGTSVRLDDRKSVVKRRRLKNAVASLLLVGGSVVVPAVAAAPAEATMVYNNMYCEPDTGWCYQTNPPYVSGIPHYCRWNYRLSNLHSGMWYTGCDIWGPEIH